jgi:aspartate/methionine/tyrosine aminotransferase
MWFNRMLIEKESPEEFGYDKIKYNFTESSTTDKTMADVGIKISDDLLLCYGDHLGKFELREKIGEDYGLKPKNVMVTVGACMGLFTIYSTLLVPGDHVVLMSPNYPANIEVPRSLGCKVDLLELKFEDDFKIDLEKLASLIKPETKIVNITYPHNPSGAMVDEETLKAAIELCEQKGCLILVDETYGDLVQGNRIPRAASLSKNAISIESLSKAMGIPGIRTGWVVSQDMELLERFVAAKEQICICGSAIDEDCAYQVISNKKSIMKGIYADVKEKFEIVADFMEKQDCLEWVKPAGGVVCFPRIRTDIELDTKEFYEILNNKYGVFVGPGRWFDLDDRYFRLGYAWPTKEELIVGLPLICQAVKEAQK